MCMNGLAMMGRAALRETRTATPAETLLARLDLATKATAEVQDLYSRPIATTPVIPLVTAEHRVPTADAA